MDKELRKALAAKIDEGEFGVGDIRAYLALFAEIGNENEDMKDEVEGWDRVVVLQLQEGDAHWLKVAGGAFSSGQGVPGAVDLVLKAKGATIAAILCGEKDATMAYSSGALIVEGKLPDAVKMRSLIGLVREEIEE